MKEGGNKKKQNPLYKCMKLSRNNKLKKYNFKQNLISLMNKCYLKAKIQDIVNAKMKQNSAYFSL